eukprot:TRINITY_DN3396_c0_g2_i1.p1 TRINITY_DN3396_c0_g2~~TRINITY_DN3396_c0_g2_i1.p1  ORF type:complete len:2486 (-),score=723.71 TRINITY_DN3396_c0_g2_i1:1285-8742(-)
MSETVALRIKVVSQSIVDGRKQDTSITKKLRFNNNTLVSDMMVDIISKIGDEGGEDAYSEYGIFLPLGEGGAKDKAKWLQGRRMLGYYGFSNGILLEFKKKTRALKFELVDGSSKMVMIDESEPVSNICLKIADKIDLENPEEFSLQKKLDAALNKAPEWLNEQLTLHEQDIGRDTILVYAKRFFYGDEYVNEDDSVQLYLLYVEAHNAIIHTKYPVTEDEACTLGSLDLQVIYGDYRPPTEEERAADREASAFDISHVLPVEYQKNKKLRQKIIQGHSRLVGLPLKHAQLRYVQTVRALPTYGITFFRVQQIHDNQRKKPSPCYLGITRDKILKRSIDNIVEKEWLLEHMARWAVVKGVFTLDFGDYEKSYLNFITEEGDAISSLMNGYIDMKLKAILESNRGGDDDEEEYAAIEETAPSWENASEATIGSYAAPYQSHGMQMPGMNTGMQYAQMGMAGMGYGYGINGQNSGMSLENMLPKSYRINVVDMGSAMHATRLLSTELGSAVGSWGRPGDKTEDEWRELVGMHANNLTAQIGDIIGMATGEFTRKDLDVQAKTMTIEMFDLATSIHNVVALNEGNSSMLNGAKSVSDSISNLMQLMMNVADDPNNPLHATQLELAERSFQNSVLLLSQASPLNMADSGSKKLMLECIDDVDQQLGFLMAQIGDNEDLDESVLAGLAEEIQKVDGAKKWLLSSLRNLTPAVLDDLILEEVNFSANQLSLLSGQLQNAYLSISGGGDLPPNMAAASIRVNDALKNLLDATRTAERSNIEGKVDVLTPANLVLAGLDQIKHGLYATETLIAGVANTAKAHNSAIAVAKLLANGMGVDDVTHDSLLNSANDLSLAIRGLIGEARVLSKHEGNEDMQTRVLEAVDITQLRTEDLIEGTGSIAALHNLRLAAKNTAASIIKLSGQVEVCTPLIADENVRDTALSSATNTKKNLTELLEALALASKEPSNYVNQSVLLEAARKQIPSYSELASLTKRAVRHIDDPNKKQSLNLASAETTDNLHVLMQAVAQVSDIGGQTEIEDALEDFDSVRVDLDNALFMARKGLITPIAGQSRENAIELLNLATKTLMDAIDNIISTAKRGGRLPELVRQAATGISQVNAAVRAMASTIADRDSQVRVISAAKDLNEDTLELIRVGRVLAIDPKNKGKNKVVGNQREVITNDIATLIAASHGLDAKELNDAMNAIAAEKALLEGVVDSGVSYKEASEALLASGKSLSAAVSQLVQITTTNPAGIASVAKFVGNSATQILQAAAIAAGTSPDSGTSESLLDAANALADSLRDLLGNAKVTASKKNEENIDRLNKSSVTVAGFIEEIITALGNATSPEAEEAVNKIMQELALLDEADVLPMTRDQLLEEFQNASKNMARISGSIVSASRVSVAKLGLFSTEAAEHVVHLLRTAHAATLSGTDNDSISPTAARIIKSAEYIQKHPKETKKVLNLSKDIIKIGSKLIATSKRQATSPETSDNTKANIIKGSQVVVNAITRLTQAARLSSNKGTTNIKNLKNVAAELISAVSQLDQYMNESGRANTDDVIDAGTIAKLMEVSKVIAISTTGLIRASSALAANENNERAALEVSGATKQISSNIQELIEACGELNPGIKECDVAIDYLDELSKSLDAATINLTLGDAFVGLDTQGKSLNDAQAETAEICKLISADLKEIVIGAQSSTTDLVVAAQKFQASIPQLGISAQITAALSGDPTMQGDLLGAAKSLTDNLLDLFKNVKILNPNDRTSMNHMRKSAQGVSESIGDLLGNLQTTATLIEDLENIKANMVEQSSSLSSPFSGNPRSYQVCRNELVAASKQLTAQLGKLQTGDIRNFGQVAINASQINDTINNITELGKESVKSTTEQVAKDEMVGALKDIVNSTTNIVSSLQEIVHGENRKNELNEHSRTTNMAIGRLVGAAKKGAIGEVMIDQAIETVSGAVLLLNTSAIYSQAGQLEVDATALSKTLLGLEREIKNAANRIVQSADNLKDSVEGTDEDVGNAATDFANTLDEISKVAVQIASRMNDALSQQDVLSSTKFLSLASQQIILASKDAQILPDEQSAKNTLIASHIAIANNVTNLIESVQLTIAEAARGELELENARVALLELIDNAPTKEGAKPMDTILAARSVVTASSELVFASNQEELISAGQHALSGIEELLATAYGASVTAPSQNIQSGLLDAALDVARAMASLIDFSKLNRKDEGTQPKLVEGSAAVTDSLYKFVSALNKLPGAENLKLEDDSKDIESVAEQELMNCANIIAEAAASLLDLKPKRRGGLLNQDDINNAILTAAKSIAVATGRLIECASVCQSERKNEIKAEGARYNNDPTWANGLISAAQSVAAAVTELVKAANSAVQGEAGEEALIATARAVAASTAHLRAASRARADPDAPSQRKLAQAAKAVAKSTGELVSAAHTASEFADEFLDDGEGDEFGQVGGAKRNMEQQVKIMSLEKSIEEERRRMLDMRKAKYANARARKAAN